CTRSTSARCTPLPRRAGWGSTPRRSSARASRRCRSSRDRVAARLASARVKIGIFYEHQLPRPWEEGDEARLIADALDQCELADAIGIDYVWEVEHHFLEEYSHSSAPEVFLGAVSQRTKRIRLGHGIVQTPPPFHHPARLTHGLPTRDRASS